MSRSGGKSEIGVSHYFFPLTYLLVSTIECDADADSSETGRVSDRLSAAKNSCSQTANFDKTLPNREARERLIH